MADGIAQHGQDPADATRIQRFLEEAAPIILESRTLDDQRLDQVLAVAQRYHVNQSELWRELRWLARRGVITDAPWKRLTPPKSSPPPLPTDKTAPDTKAPDTKAPDTKAPDTKAPDTKAPDTEAADTEDVESRPTDTSQPRPDRAARRGGTEPLRVEPARPVPAPPPQVAPEPVCVPDRGGERADTDGPGVWPPQLPPDAASPASSTAPPTPIAEPPPAAEPAPIDAFAAWVQRKLAVYPSALVAVDDESGLIGVGIHRHHLAEVLARHVVREMVARSGRRLERDVQVASEHSTVGSTSLAAEDQEKLQRFFDRVAPILALHRGINTQSRILMSAVAQQMGLTEDQFDQAIAQLQRSASGPPGEDPQQVERLESFRKYLRRAIAQLPGGIITFRTLQRLEEAGEYFHGVVRERITPTIREVASETGARFISKEQALEHVAALVDDVWERGGAVTGETRARIYAEGTQWGLDPMDVESVLRAQTHQRRAEAARDRRRTGWLILLASVTILSACMLLGYLLGPEPPRPTDGDGLQVGPIEPPPPAAPRDTDGWLDAELRIAIAKARSWLPDKREQLDALQAPLPSARGTAYEQLAQDAVAAQDDPTVREVLQPVLVGLFAREPSDATADQLAGAVLRNVIELESRPPEQRGQVEALYWACRTAVAMWTQPGLTEDRASQLAARLESAVGQPLDRLTDLQSLERACLTALTRRLYSILTRWEPERAAQLHAVVFELMEVAGKYVERDVRDTLDAALLTVILPALDDGWSYYEEVLQRLVASSDPHVVVQVLQLYEDSTNVALQTYLASLLAKRIGAADSGLRGKQLVAEVRRELGIPDRRAEARRWSELTERAGKALAEPPLEGTLPAVLLEKAVDLAHLTTAACALAQGPAGEAVYEALETDGPPNLDTSSGPWSVPSGSPLVADPRENSSTYVEQYIVSLVRAKRPDDQIRLLGMIANAVGQVRDVSPEAGQALAEFLVDRKANKELRAQSLTLAPQLSKWTALRLGMADQLAKVDVTNRQTVDLYGAMFGHTTDVSREADRVALRRQLLQQAADALAAPIDSSSEQEHLATQATEVWTGLLRKQAALLGVPADQYSTAERMSTLLIPLIHRTAASLNREALSDPDRLLVDRLDQQLVASRFLAEDDLHYTIQLQQILARLLAWQVIQTRPDRGPDARQTLAEMEQLGARSRHVFAQLWYVNATLLKLWLLHQPAAAEKTADTTT